MNDRTKNLIILGAGGHGRVVADAASATGLWEQIVFLDDRFPGLTLSGPWKVVGKFSDAPKFLGDFQNAVVGVGGNPLRLKLLTELAQRGFNLPIIKHPSSIVSSGASVGQGTVMFAQTVINFGARLGDGCIVNTGATIDHDCEIGNGVHISPGAHLAGEVKVGNCGFIGVGASVKHQITIGENVTVGAGSAVVKNVDSNLTVVGVPARVLSKGQN